MENIINNNQNDDFDVKQILKIGLRYWYLFVILPAACVIIAAVAKKLTVPTFTSTASILVKWDDALKSSKMLDLSGALGGGNLFGYDGEIDDEITIIKSHRLFGVLVNDLNLRTESYIKKDMLWRLMYQNEPLVTVFPQNFVANLKGKFTIWVDKHKDGSFTFKFEVFENKVKISEKHKVKSLDEPIQTQWGDFSFVEQAKFIPKDDQNYDLKLVTYSLKGMIARMNAQINVTRNTKNSNILVFSTTSSNARRSEDILNKLVDIYQKDKIADQNQISVQMADFITERLGLISTELKDVEQKVETYRKKHNIADISAQSHEAIEKSSDYEKQIVNVEIQLSLLGFIEDYLKKADANELLPANMGIQDANVMGMINSYNELVLKNQQLSTTATAENPAIIRLQSQINNVKANILQSIDNFKKSAEITKKDLNRKNSDYLAKINQVPTIQREFTDISRQQQIKETLYIFLLQKREEAQLSLAMATSSAKIVETAYTGSNPTAMGFGKMAMLAFVIGLVLAAGVVYVLEFFKDKVASEDDLKRRTKLPIIGTLPLSKTDDYVVVIPENHSIIGEKFRMLRTNLQFFLPNKGSKVVLVTSSMPSEGKSFVSVNLALSLAMINKKVALVGCDVRKPRLAKYLKLNAKTGVTNFIVDENVTLNQIENQLEINKNISVFVGGTIPPNPSEVLYNERFDLFFEELRAKFDYIIVDTAPIGILTDTFIISRVADAVIYVVKSDVAKYSDIKHLNELTDTSKLKNVSILLNNVEEEGVVKKYGHYGYY